ncbi:MAG: amino acid permease [Clostridia bacterium]|nr:amino acid permease [Clostridia bacterium]
MSKTGKSDLTFQPFLSPLTVMAFAVGTSLGWGSLVVTANTYLRQAGPWGSVFGLLAGAVVMLLVCRNYHYVSNKYPDGAGVYTYTKSIFGYDRAFLISWFVFLLYFSIFLANATAVPLFVRYAFGDVFRFGYLYTIFGYEVYIGEILLTAAAIGLTVLLLIRSKRGVAKLMVVLVALFLVGLVVCFAVAMIRHFSGSEGFDPGFVPDSLPIGQVAKIACISPWAFIGFESVTHSLGEFRFSKTKLFRLLAASVVISTALYIFVTLLSVTAYPPRYENWLAYINDLGNLSGLEALPAFYAAGHYLGNTGLVLLFVSLFALVATSLIANLWALSRLICAVAQDSILPEKFAKLNRRGNPANAFLLVAGLSVVLIFLGRSAIGWIVDVTTIMATLLYGIVAVAAMKCAKVDKRKTDYFAGLIVLIVMVCFGAVLLVPGLRSDSLEAETYLLFILWSVLGMVFFHRVIAKDQARHFGKAIIVWLFLISLIIFLGIIWMEKIEKSASEQILTALENYHAGNASAEILAMSESEYVAVLDHQFDKTSLTGVFVVLGLFALSIGGFVSNYFSMRKYETLLEKEVAAKTDHIVEMQNNLVIGMATMVESRDNSTGGHIRRTSDVVRILVDEMKKDNALGMSDSFYADVIKAAPMHDLGKIAVDDGILRKPGRFTPEEYEVMKSHAKEGARIVEEIMKNTDDEQFRRIAVNMAHYHHEWVNGAGYLEKLKDDEIPLEARIMAIADVYDALVSKRVYKEKMTFEEADRIILGGMGTQFDSRLLPYYEAARPKLEAYYAES